MTKTETAAKNLAGMLSTKVAQATANGATEDQAIEAVRALWLETLRAS